MFSLLFIFIIFIFSYFNKSTYLAILFLPSLFFYYLAFELRNSTFVKEYFYFGFINDYSIYIFVGLLLTFSTFISLSSYFNNNSLEIKRLESNLNIYFSVPRAKILYYLLSFLSIVSFFFNFQRVNFDINLLFLFPRQYEEIFGQNSLINYIYFLNVPAICLFIYLRHYKINLKFSLIINLILVLISFFHGIKFTVFDTFLFPVFFYFHLNKFSRKNLVAIFFILFFLLVFYLTFSFFVRGSTDEDISIVSSVLNYILPNYYNLAYSFDVTPFQFDPISPFLPDKLLNPFQAFFFQGDYGFVLNDKFNMSTAFNVYYGLFPLISLIFLLPCIVFLRRKVLSKLLIYQDFKFAFLISYIDFCIFFTWYFFAFNKTKYVYFVFIAFVLSKFMKKKKNVEIV